MEEILVGKKFLIKRLMIKYHVPNFFAIAIDERNNGKI